MFFGDFNDLLYATDKEGVHPHSQSLMDGFRSAIEDCNLVEVDLMGGKYTWEKSKGKPNWVKERLDRAFATEGWWQKFPLGTLELRHAIVSDHEPIELKLMDTLMSRKHFRFRFENSWLKEPSFKAEVEGFWKALPATHILPKLISVSSFMSKWGRNFYHKFRDKVKRQKEILNALKDREDEEGIKSYFEEREKLNEFLEHEESYWKQRAKIFWLKEGDTNSRFFHVQASKRKKCNRTMGGKWILMTRCADLNSINLVLIPKKENVDNLKDVRPIALYNVLYKILAKVLANRLKKVLPVVITENQSAFVQGRSITDNVLISFELIHFMKRKKGSQDGEVALKLDISKAYDRSLSNEIEKMFNGFWWKSGKNGGKGIRWHAWDKMCTAKNKGGLGFRCMYGYNLALLGKHVWNFLKNPESLVARIFKARYFPDKYVLEAQKGSNASFIWSGICAAKDEFYRGFKWVLGDGLNIDIFTDQWLRGKSYYKVDTDHTHNTRIDKVCEFFRPYGKQWDEAKVTQTFHDGDARCILNTRIPQNQIQDRVAWLHTKDGQYSVKSSYHYWFDINHAQNLESDSQGWARLWKLQILHKLKFFLWRVCKRNLPVRNMLRGKGVNVTILCPMCNTDVEHFRHLFLECPYGKGCWSYVGKEYDVIDVEHVSTWVLEWLSSESNSCLVRLARTLWGIWFARNRKVWEDKQTPPNVAMEVASKMVDEWQKAQQKNQLSSNTPNRSENESQVHWEKPQGGWKKVNVDASVYDGSSSFKIGLVLRDDSGSFIAGLQSCMAGQVSSMEAEVIDVHEALCSIQSLGLGNIAVECDALNVVSAVQKGTVYFSEVGSILDSCRHILRQRSDLKIQHVRRQANSVAHNIAKLPYLLGTVNSFTSAPSCVLEFVLRDSMQV
ncbi:hypothetical protein AgCh_035211 [Apium graveolens]